ncbi:hypothetical protein AB0J35_36840 [Nonomuraea angiospora]|uniref:hypothetical protein n=1 Tax=Nonomuraea angiospora TaxID=46172 RepID=UPI003418CDD4
MTRVHPRHTRQGGDVPQPFAPPSTDASATSVKTAIEKLIYLRNMDAHTLDMSALAAERRRFLASAGRRSTNQALERREAQRRYPILLAVVTQSAIDQVIVVSLFEFSEMRRNTVPHYGNVRRAARRALGWRSLGPCAPCWSRGGSATP